MNFQQLNKILHDSTILKEEKIKNYSIKVENLSFLQLRDILITMGKIHKEDLEQNIYVVSIKGGFAHLNTAVLAIHLNNNDLLISIYADEGLINQHTVEGVLNDFKRKIKSFIQE